MKKNKTNKSLAEHYLHYLLQEAARSDRQMERLARRLDNLEKHCSENPVSQTEEEVEVDKVKKRMYSVGISYYATRADYCYRKAWSLGNRRNSQCKIQNSFGNTGKSNN